MWLTQVVNPERLRKIFFWFLPRLHFARFFGFHSFDYRYFLTGSGSPTGFHSLFATARGRPRALSATILWTFPTFPVGADFSQKSVNHIFFIIFSVPWWSRGAKIGLCGCFARSALYSGATWPTGALVRPSPHSRRTPLLPRGTARPQPAIHTGPYVTITILTLCSNLNLLCIRHIHSLFYGVMSLRHYTQTVI